MDYNPYEILGLTSSATRAEVDERYKTLRDRFARDRFAVGQQGEDAAENLQRLEVAYREILTQGTYEEQTSDAGSLNVQQLIKDGKLDQAQDILDNRDNRDAEWHYLQSIIFYKRSWFLESKKQLEFACQIEPNNQRYKDSLDKLNKILASNTISPDQLRTNSRPTGDGVNVGAGNGTCSGNACVDCLMCNACCNCMQCMGGC